jgi:hypothetical protein
MTLIQKWKPAGAVIVSTPQDLALIDATRAIDLFRKLDVPIIGLVENMAGYQCPSCGEMSDPFGAGGAEAAARVMDIPFLGRVPLTLHIREASDAGDPPASGEGYESGIFKGIAQRLLVPHLTSRSPSLRADGPKQSHLLRSGTIPDRGRCIASSLRSAMTVAERGGSLMPLTRDEDIAELRRSTPPSPWWAHPTGRTAQATA